jgi:hypothetical protein
MAFIQSARDEARFAAGASTAATADALTEDSSLTLPAAESGPVRGATVLTPTPSAPSWECGPAAKTLSGPTDDAPRMPADPIAPIARTIKAVTPARMILLRVLT